MVVKFLKFVCKILCRDDFIFKHGWIKFLPLYILFTLFFVVLFLSFFVFSSNNIFSFCYKEFLTLYSLQCNWWLFLILLNIKIMMYKSLFHLLSGSILYYIICRTILYILTCECLIVSNLISSLEF